METTAKISNAQTEVWEWKEKASEELNRLSKEERIAYLKKYEMAFREKVKNQKRRKADAVIQ